jgi:hypothetical protein
MIKKLKMDDTAVVAGGNVTEKLNPTYDVFLNDDGNDGKPIIKDCTNKKFAETTDAIANALPREIYEKLINSGNLTVSNKSINLSLRDEHLNTPNS